MRLQRVVQADYNARMATMMAGGDLPDLVYFGDDLPIAQFLNF